ncbi:unnamed protein product, partial [Rotaria sp. Silwood1]
MINSSSIISSSSDNILIELVTELYERTKQSSTLPYEALLLLRPLPLLLAHIGLSDRLMKKMFLEFATSTQHLYPQNRLYSTTTISLEDATCNTIDIDWFNALYPLCFTSILQ